MDSNKEKIIHKIDAEGLSYWLTDYFSFKEVEKAFGKDIASKCQEAADALSSVELWYNQIYDEYLGDE